MEDRQSLALDRLTNHFGKWVGRSWLMNEVFPGRPAAEVHAEFDALIREITAAVPSRGLMLVCANAPGGGTTYSLRLKPGHR